MDSRYYSKALTSLAFKSLVYEKTPSPEMAEALRTSLSSLEKEELERYQKIEVKDDAGNKKVEGYIPPEVDYELVKKTLPTMLVNALESALLGLSDEYVAMMYDQLSTRFKDLGKGAQERFNLREMDDDDLEEKKYQTDRAALLHEMQEKSQTEWLVAYVNDVNTIVYGETESEARAFAERAGEIIRIRAGWKAAPRIRAIGKPQTFVIAYDDGSHEAFVGLDERSAENYARHVHPLKSVDGVFSESEFDRQGLSEHHIN